MIDIMNVIKVPTSRVNNSNSQGLLARVNHLGFNPYTNGLIEMIFRLDIFGVNLKFEMDMGKSWK